MKLETRVLCGDQEQESVDDAFLPCSRDRSQPMGSRKRDVTKRGRQGGFKGRASFKIPKHPQTVQCKVFMVQRISMPHPEHYEWN